MKILVDGNSPDPQDSPRGPVDANSHRDKSLPDFVQKRYSEPMQQNGDDPHLTESDGDAGRKEVIEDIRNRSDTQDSMGKPNKKATMYVALAFVMVAIIIGIMMYINLKENGRSEN